MFTNEELQIIFKPNDNGRYFALHKYLNYALSPAGFIYEKQGVTSLILDYGNDLSIELYNIYVRDRYYVLSERDQILNDLSEVLFMWNYRLLQLNSLVNSVQNPIDFKSARPDIVSALNTSKEIIELGATAGIWRLTTVTATGGTVVTMIGSLALELATAAAYFGAVFLVGSLIQSIINKAHAEQVEARTFDLINAVQQDLNKLIGTNYYDDTKSGVDKVGGYLKGLLDLAGMKLVTDANGIVKIIDDKTNPNNPNYKETIDKPFEKKEQLKIPETPEEKSNTFYYVLGGLVAIKLIK